jgi:hypothetical protein
LVGVFDMSSGTQAFSISAPADITSMAFGKKEIHVLQQP